MECNTLISWSHLLPHIEKNSLPLRIAEQKRRRRKPQNTGNGRSNYQLLSPGFVNGIPLKQLKIIQIDSKNINSRKHWFQKRSIPKKKLIPINGKKRKTITNFNHLISISGGEILNDLVKKSSSMAKQWRTSSIIGNFKVDRWGFQQGRTLVERKLEDNDLREWKRLWDREMEGTGSRKKDIIRKRWVSGAMQLALRGCVA